MDEKIKLVFSESRMFHKEFKKVLARKMKDTDISLDQCRLLFMLDHDASMNQKKLAELLHITQATLSVRISRLEKSGYIIKKVDTKDKRNFSLEVSQRGKDILNEKYSILEKTMYSMFEGISEEELDSMLVLLNKMKSNIERGE